ncbi:MAG: hypothetical protein ACP5SP_08170, partial [Caldisericum sp.]
KTFHVNNIEGDFLLSYIYYKNYQQDALNIIISTDKDFYQLMSNKNTMVYNPLTDDIVTKDNFLEKLKISKSTLDINNFLLLKILMGDKSDNIPGITGINTSVKMINIILSENNYKEILNLDDFLNMVNDYVDKKPNHLKVFDKLLENKEHFKLSSKIMDLSENNVLEM